MLAMVVQLSWWMGEVDIAMYVSYGCSTAMEIDGMKLI